MHPRLSSKANREPFYVCSKNEDLVWWRAACHVLPCGQMLVDQNNILLTRCRSYVSCTLDPGVVGWWAAISIVWWPASTDIWTWGPDPPSTWHYTLDTHTPLHGQLGCSAWIQSISVTFLVPGYYSAICPSQNVVPAYLKTDPPLVTIIIPDQDWC